MPPAEARQPAQPAVGLVVVSHSPVLAKGVVDVARAMAHPALRIEPVGGASGRLGTDAAEVMVALRRARGPGGVLVLADLGSAVIASETAVDLLGWSTQEVVVSGGPLVEGAVAAAVAASAGAGLARVAAEAEAALQSKADLAPRPGSGGEALPPAPRDRPRPDGGHTRGASIEFDVDLPHGLHARPAASLVRAVTGVDALVEVSNVTTGSGPVSGSSLSALVGLGVRSGHRVQVAVGGPDAPRVLARVGRVLADRFGEQGDGPQPGPGAGDVGAGPGSFKGLPASPGRAVGPVLRLQTASGQDVPGRSRPGAGWPELEAAIGSAREELASHEARLERQGLHEAARLVEVQRLLLDDDAFAGPARSAAAAGAGAAQGWELAVARAARSWEATGDAHLAGRVPDLTAVSDLVLAKLRGDVPRRVHPQGVEGILFSGPLDPATLARLDRSILLGLAVVGGSPADHTSVMARSLGVPAVVGLPGETGAIPAGTVVGLDGGEGVVEVDPPEEKLALYRDARPPGTGRAGRAATTAASRTAATLDGREIGVLANVASVAEAARAAEAGADGIGLVRTELLFAGWDRLPDEDEQLELLRRLGDAIGERPLTVRTFDAGADKQLPWLAAGPEPNPALGQRGLRLCLARPHVLEAQLRDTLCQPRTSVRCQAALLVMPIAWLRLATWTASS